MNCFEWQSRSSDYLDCTLIGIAKREADEHLETCRDCNEKYKHYRLILTAVAGQPRSSLPVPIRKAPFETALPRRSRKEQLLARWKHLPWFIRSSLEGLGIVMIILLGISTGPKLRALYERGLERSMSEFGESAEPLSALEAANSGAGGPVNPRIPLVPGAQFADGTLTPVAHEGDDFSAAEAQGEESDSDAEEDSGAAAAGDRASGSATAGGPVAAGRAEIWRFNIKTDSPQEIRAKVAQTLSELKIATRGLHGIDAPGGVQFDLLISQPSVGELKQALEKLAPAPHQDSFTWYKSKSRKPIPAGKTRVVIWLSQT